MRRRPPPPDHVEIIVADTGRASQNRNSASTESSGFEGFIRAMSIKVIGAGFGRTGTLSLKAALEELGLVKCYHMTDVLAHLEHAMIWDNAARGEPIDWDALFRGYQATVDWPGCTSYEQLLGHYTGATR